ncbi:MAG TPA: hypothetical protein VFM08_09140 [Nocardioides sp.]|jgi:hypothetical protein|nr:hypothetical protein [Nocardioides sp.]
MKPDVDKETTMNAISSAQLVRQWFELHDDRGLIQHVKPRRTRNIVARWFGDPE